VGLHVAGPRQRFLEQLPLEFLDRFFERQPPAERVLPQGGGMRVCAERRRQMFRRDRRSAAPDERLLEHVFELTDVAGPVVFRQDFQRLFRDFQRGASIRFKPPG